MYWLLIHCSYYPESQNTCNIVAAYDNKEEAFKNLIDRELNIHRSYEQLSLVEVIEDDINCVQRKYNSVGNFITSNNEIVYHRNNDQNLINRNIKLKEKYDNIQKNIDELNNLFQKEYDNEMISYKNKQNRHPVLKKYQKNFIFFSYIPYCLEKIEKFENIINSTEQFINNRLNDLRSKYNTGI
jgi:hypothetical protein